MPYLGWLGGGNITLPNGDQVQDCEITRCAQYVDFSRPFQPGCWARAWGLDNTGLSCGNPAKGDLGLCPEHQLEILGREDI